MIRINENYLKLQASYLFSEIRRRTDEFQEKHPDKEIIKLGIGDVTRPLPQACIAAFHRAVDESGQVGLPARRGNDARGAADTYDDALCHTAVSYPGTGTLAAPGWKSHTAPVAQNIQRTPASTEKPAIISTVSPGIRTRSGFRLA